MKSAWTLFHFNIFLGGEVCKFVSYKILIILEEIFASIIIYFAWYEKSFMSDIMVLLANK